MRPPGDSRGRGGERGLALIIVLFVVTLLAIIVLEFTYATRIDAHLTRNALAALQARSLARSGAAFGELALLIDSVQKATDPANHPPVETSYDLWARPFGPIAVGEGLGTVAYRITDESAKFNLNSLSVTRNPLLLEMRKQLFQGILVAVGLDENLLFPLLDWLDENDETDRESGAEGKYYLDLSPPYLPRNGRLLTLDELGLVKGFSELDPTQWQTLRSLVTVLPDENLRINVNTAPELLLVALLTAAGDPTIAGGLVTTRVERPFQDLREVNAIPGMDQIPPLVRSVFEVRSTVFAIRSVGEAAGVRRGLVWIVERPRGGRTLRPIERREEAAPPSLTSPDASGGIPAAL